MEGARFDRVVVRRRRLRTLLPLRFASRLEGTTVRQLGRRGKYLVAELSTGDMLVMHLGMSGSFAIHPDRSASFVKHDHVIFDMSSGKTVVFNDPRRFGSMWLHDHRSPSPVGTLGPEPLADDFTADVLAKAFRRRRAPIKTSLLDQRIVAGLGNIYASEALHRARISPARAADTLVAPSGRPRPELRALVRAIRQTLDVALRKRSDDEDDFRVYDHEDRRCPRRGCRGTITRILQAGRSTFFCPTCQR
jgi:formamidopyrimidine-DNA glycosylase